MAHRPGKAKGIGTRTPQDLARGGLRQSALRGVAVQWGRSEERLARAVPFFAADYKVLGLLGVTPQGGLRWYGGTPAHASARHVAFKDTAAGPPAEAAAALDAKTLHDAFYFDPQEVLLIAATGQPAARALEAAVNLARHRLLDRRVVDVVYERSLHRVRGFLLAGPLGRPHPLAVYAVPGLRASLEPPPDSPETRMDPAAAAEAAQREPRWLRLVRLLLGG